MYQKTLRRSLEIKGKALHSGRLVRVVIHPAAANTGIVFRRTDTNLSIPIVAHASNISSTELSTSIGDGASSVSTIEHMMAAFFVLGIENAYVEINGPEVPILDGSSAPFVSKMRCAGISDLPVPRSVYRVVVPFEFSLGESTIKLEPAGRFSAQCSIDFDRDLIGQQTACFLNGEEDLQRLVEARTFCHINDVNSMRRRGLALGGSLENAVVISDTGVINEEGLRNPNEFAEHKLLDLLGDLALLGKAIIGKVTAYKPGHTVHANFMWELLSDIDAYMTTELLTIPVAIGEDQSVYAFG